MVFERTLDNLRPTTSMFAMTWQSSIGHMIVRDFEWVTSMLQTPLAHFLDLCTFSGPLR